MREKYYYFEAILVIITLTKFFLDQNSNNFSLSFWTLFLSTTFIGYAIEGGRPYTGLVVLVALAGLLGYAWLELILVLFLGACVLKFRYYHIQILKQGLYRAGFRL